MDAKSPAPHFVRRDDHWDASGDNFKGRDSMFHSAQIQPHLLTVTMRWPGFCGRILGTCSIFMRRSATSERYNMFMRPASLLLQVSARWTEEGRCGGGLVH